MSPEAAARRMAPGPNAPRIYLRARSLAVIGTNSWDASVVVPAFEVVELSGVLGVSTGGLSTPAGWADAGVCINITPTAKHKNRPIPFASIGSERVARMPSEGQ